MAAGSRRDCAHWNVSQVPAIVGGAALFTGSAALFTAAVLRGAGTGTNRLPRIFEVSRPRDGEITSRTSLNERLEEDRNNHVGEIKNTFR